MGEKADGAGNLDLEEFMYYCGIAHDRGNTDAFNQLCRKYPELADRFTEESGRLARQHREDRSEQEIHPIVEPSSRMTQRRVLDMVAYLLGQERAPRRYREELEKRKIPYRVVFNYHLDRFRMDYEREALWSDYFCSLPELRRVLEYRRIASLTELEYRSSEYFRSLPLGN